MRGNVTLWGAEPRILVDTQGPTRLSCEWLVKSVTETTRKAMASCVAVDRAIWDYRTCSTAKVPAGSGRQNLDLLRVRSSQAGQSSRSRTTICRL